MLTGCNLFARSAISLVAGLFLSCGVAAYAGGHDYLALGDSLAFGQGSSLMASNGNQGYAGLLNTWLGPNYFNGNPSTLINLGISGETSSTFLNGGNPSEPFSTTYTTYPGLTGTTSQDSALSTVIAHEHSLGNSIDVVTFDLGADDFNAFLSNPAFLVETPAQQQADLIAANTALENNTTTILTQVHTALPQARLVLLDYYNPYVPSTTPNVTFDTLAAAEANIDAAFLQGLAPSVGSKFIDIEAPFIGHESAYTYIGMGNVHPNSTGYGVIASQIEGQAFIPVKGQALVPEPKSILAFVLGGLGLGGLILKRCFASVEK